MKNNDEMCFSFPMKLSTMLNIIILDCSFCWKLEYTDKYTSFRLKNG